MRSSCEPDVRHENSCNPNRPAMQHVREYEMCAKEANLERSQNP